MRKEEGERHGESARTGEGTIIYSEDKAAQSQRALGAFSTRQDEDAQWIRLDPYVECSVAEST
jgi:hypothetical protein